MKSTIATAVALYLVTSAAIAQVPGFPVESTTPSADEIRAHVVDKKFSALRQDGRGLRYEYKSDGTFHVMMGSFTERGTWVAEPGRICVNDPKNGEACNEVRIYNGSILYRRNSNGEVYELKPQ